MKRQHRRLRVSPRVKRMALISSGAIVGLFVLINVGLGLAYHNRTYPNTKVMDTKIGSVSYGNLSQKLGELKLLPASLQLTHGTAQKNFALSDLGISKDISRTTASADKQRSWLPVMNLWKSPELAAPIAIDNTTLAKQNETLGNTFKQDATNAHLSLNGTTVSIAKATNGYTFDASKLKDTILAQLDKGKSKIDVPTKAIQPTVTDKSLSSAQQALQQQLAVSVTYKFDDKSRVVKADEIAKWYVPSAETLVVSDDVLTAFITQVGNEFGIHVKSAGQVAATTKQNLEAHKTVDVTLAKQTAVKTFTYCTAVKGVDASNLPGLKTRLQSTYSDPKGWSLGGLIDFKYADSGCDYTVWLTASNLMPSFGEICDSMWSCRVGPNVVINFDRWQGASPAWQQYGGTLEDYRHMVINHESGHWLGFSHRTCPGAGQLAPVMQQQSIDLQGCKFNPWPAPDELAALKRNLGL